MSQTEQKMPCPLCGTEATLFPRVALQYQLKCDICGYYTATEQCLLVINQYDMQKYLLSALTRRASDGGSPLTLTMENVPKLLQESVQSIGTLLDYLNRTLVLIGEKQPRVDKTAELNLKTDYPLVLAHDSDEFYYLLETLVRQGYMEAPGTRLDAGIRLTPNGWRRFLEIKESHQYNQAFVAMAFSKELDEAWGKGFMPALEATGFHPYRVDKIEHNEKIDDLIFAEIRRSGLLVADFTEHRQGVYFEAGLAMGLGINVIRTCREDQIKDAHFDTRQFNHILWKDPAELKQKLIRRIEASIPGRLVHSQND